MGARLRTVRARGPDSEAGVVCAREGTGEHLDA